MSDLVGSKAAWFVRSGGEIPPDKIITVPMLGRMPRCLQRHHTRRLYCSRAPLHTGRHNARRAGGVVLAVWS